MATGTVKFFNYEKGFGFILEDETQNEVFITKSSLKDRIREGDLVIFTMKFGNKGPKAIHVKLV